MAGKTAGGNEIIIRAPRESEWPACRMLLPEAFSSGPAPDVLLAFGKQNAHILGAAAFRAGPGVISLIMTRVVRTHRRRRIGTALVREILACGREAEAYADAIAHPEAEPFLTANGFRHVSRIHTLETDLEPMRLEMIKLLERVRASRRLPESARIVRPSQAPLDEMVRIYDEQISVEQRRHPDYLRASLSDARFEEPSSVLLVDDHVAAMVLVGYDREHRRALVQAKVVLNGFRGGLANIQVMADALEKGRAAGIERIRFEALDDSHDTRKLARRFNGETVHIRDRYTRAATRLLHDRADT